MHQICQQSAHRPWNGSGALGFITDITGSFLTGRPTTRERAKAVRQTIGEVTKTRTPQPTKEIGDILSAYVGEDEE